MTLEALTELNRAIRENRLGEVSRVLGREPGMSALGFEPGLSRWEWRPSDERARNPFGFVFGGYLAVFVDALLSSVLGTVLEEGELATTADLRVAYVRAARFAPLRGEGRIVHRGRSVAFADAEVFTESGDLVVAASSTWTVLRAAGA